jgi:hypothetical protein
MIHTKIRGLFTKLAMSTVCVLAFSEASVANPVLLDHGVYTTDTVTGLDWLDLTETRGLSFDTVSDQLGVGERFHGWRFASRVDINQFWTDSGGVGPFTGPANGNVNWVGSLQYLWGKTYPFVYTVNGKTVQGSVAMTNDSSMTCATCNLTVYLLNNIDDSGSSVGDYAEALQLNEARRSDGQVPIGMALIRDSIAAVPEPATYSMMAAGIGLIGLFARRRKMGLSLNQLTVGNHCDHSK